MLKSKFFFQRSNRKIKQILKGWSSSVTRGDVTENSGGATVDHVIQGLSEEEIVHRSSEWQEKQPFKSSAGEEWKQTRSVC